MNKKGLKVLGIIVILFCVLWCSYKAFLLFYYGNDEQSYITEKLDNSKEISVTSDKSIANTEFVDMNIFIPDEYKEYKPSTFQEDNGNGLYQKMYSSDNKTIDILLQMPSSTIDDLLNNLNFNSKKLMEKYNISNEIDILRYYKSQKSTKRNIFWSKSKLQMDYLVSLYLVTNFTPNSEDYNFIKNDLNGIMTKESKYIVVKLLNDKERYILNFNANTFTKEQVENILKSVYFK